MPATVVVSDGDRPKEEMGRSNNLGVSSTAFKSYLKRHFWDDVELPAAQGSSFLSYFLASSKHLHLLLYLPQ